MAIAAARVEHTLRRKLDVLQALQHARLHLAREHRRAGVGAGRAGTGAAHGAVIDRGRAQPNPRGRDVALGPLLNLMRAAPAAPDLTIIRFMVTLFPLE